MIIAAALAFAAAFPAAAGTVQVAILRQAGSVKIVPEGKVLVAQPGIKAKALEWKGELTLRPREGGLRMADL
ncbi:MAG: hypothetical protein Q7J64_01075, partial [Elusimicrobiota bacterium]|nr:hypothetical protein [Elusimicrobiota bacterium]